MTELKFNEYWVVILRRNPDYDREADAVKHSELMNGHFAFIDSQSNQGNMFAAIPMDSGGLYFFEGALEREFMQELIEQEQSIQGGVFLPELKRAYVADHLLHFTLESKKRLDEFTELRNSQNS